jgi:hypothetical protein
MPTDLYWLRVTVEDGASELGRVTGLYAQLVKLVRENADVATQLNEASQLPADSLKKLVVPEPPVLSVYQPLPSFGGCAADTLSQYHTRVSEVLRHRNRALTPFDYEHLLLDEFPEIYQARCRPVSQLNGLKRMPGEVIVMVLPYQSRHPTDPYYMTPVFSIGELKKMKAYLSEKAPPYCKITVVNPLYEIVRVRCRVKFNPNKVSTFFEIDQLHQDLANFISPWLKANQKDKDFQRYPGLNSLLSFMQNLDYVNHVSNFFALKTAVLDKKNLHFDSGWLSVIDSKGANSTSKFLKKALPWSVFIPASTHFISTDSETVPLKTAGIGDFKVGNDLTVLQRYKNS